MARSNTQKGSRKKSTKTEQRAPVDKQEKHKINKGQTLKREKIVIKLSTRLIQEKHIKRLYGKILEHAISKFKSCIQPGR